MEFNALMQQGIQFLQSQNYQAAAEALTKANQAMPGQAVALHFLGLALCQAGRFDDGIDFVRQSLDLAPGNVKYINNYANLLFENGRHDEAVVQYRRALEADPAYAMGWKNLGVIYLAQGLFDEAEEAARQALALKADDAASYNVLGSVLWSRRSSAAAQPCFEKAVALDGGPSEYHHNLALVLADLGLLREAIPHFQAAILRKPDDPAYHDNLGQALCQLGRDDEGYAEFQAALRLDPGFVNAYNNLGSYYTSQGEYELARQSFRQALQQKPEYPQAKYNLGIVELTCGNFGEAWPLYESRFDCAELNLQRRAAGVRWQGEPLLGRKIFVFAEQGLGDTIQFARYLPSLVKLGAQVAFECQPELFSVLKPMLESIPQILVLPRGDQEPINGDFYVSLLSLPRWLATDLSTIPAMGEFLQAKPSAMQAWSAVLAGAAKPRIGVCWAGSATHRNDRNRSIPLEQFVALAKDVPATFVSLRKEPSSARNNHQLGQIWPSLLDVSSQFADFSETAACISQLDLVVTVDTSVAHLAAASGKTVWLLLPFVPDWRWLLERDDSPWYPSMRLFRQPQLGDWASVLTQVNQALQQFVQSRPV